jgi:hypothetical protein
MYIMLLTTAVLRPKWSSTAMEMNPAPKTRITIESQ